MTASVFPQNTYTRRPTEQRTLPLKLWLNDFLLVSIIISTISDNTVVDIVSVDFRRWY